jgi:SPP1 gp7 family putative phage head morphogenesis protein
MAKDPRIGAVPTLNGELLDRGIRHAHYLERVKSHNVNRILNVLNRDVIPDLRSQIARRLGAITERGYDLGPATTRRFQELLATSEGILKGGTDRVEALARNDLLQLAQTEAEFQTRLLNGVLPTSIEMTMPNLAQLESIVTARPFRGALLGDWFSELGPGIQRRLSRELTTGLTQGETIPQLTRRLFGPRQTLDLYRHQATAIVRTATTHVANHSAEAAFQANSDVVKGVQFVATLDARTTEECASYDGKEFGFGEGPRPPLHFNCRSIVVPVVKSWQELGIDADELKPGERASIDGGAAETTTYPEWLRRQPKVVQDEALGKGKAELFRRGKYDLTKPIVGKPMTLAELRAKEGLN